MCSARADATASSFLRACRCSASRCLRVRPVYPMYTLGHPLQGMQYTNPFCWSSGTGSLGCTSKWQRVLSERKTTLMSGCLRIRLTASERPLMYGRVTVGLGFLTSTSCLPSWTRVLAYEAGEATIVLKWIYNLLLLHLLYT